MSHLSKHLKLLVILALHVVLAVSPLAAGAPCGAALFLADTNADGGVDVSDPVFFLAWLFLGGPDPACFDGGANRQDCAEAPSYYAGDCNGDGAIDISDPVCILGWLFSGGPAPACLVPAVEVVCGDGVLAASERCDDHNSTNGDGCNVTCNLTSQTSLFVGFPGQPDFLDGVGIEARIGGTGGLAAHDDVLWLADSANHVIRRIDIATGRVETVAGDAVGRTAGHRDAALGLNALLRGPSALATDGQTLWICEEVSNVLRAMSSVPPYAVTTVAGSPGVSSPFRDGIGSAAVLSNPRGLAYHGGFVYFLDATAAVLRRFDPASAEVVTLAGTPAMTGLVDGIGAAARFTSPRYLASDGRGKLYISDTNGAAVRVFEIATGFVGTFAGNGEAAYVDGVGPEVRVQRPRGITVDGRSVYWASFGRHSIRQGVIEGRSISTMVGCGSSETCDPGYAEGTGVQARLDSPFDVAHDAGSNSLFVLDSGNAVIRRIR
jgi:cysteine-rich repeat protein